MDEKRLQKLIGVHFDNDELLQQAMTHRSYLNEHPHEHLQHNERLEFLGDAVLDFLVADWLFQRDSLMPEGHLTRLRAAMVRTESLAELATQWSLGEVMRMGKGEEDSGGRTRQNNLCDAFEALVGAIYLDQGLPVVSEVVMPRFYPLLDKILAEATDKDARSLLQEWSQAHRGLTPTYRIASSSGPDHDKEFTVEVLIGINVVGQGTGKSKQSASQAAAVNALKLLKPEVL